ncbi:uncharacterized protein LOC126416819 [Schistocerca serialis cubense]|uniref:uncharacterized protein LOC126416819 n=1 Tax=Schistocerca serialis cubense TaxID=2023355 RepID=UPI00214E74BA|nr:uncharacterized protein LOC126416819 [Schistocerca serialis cubense]
MSDDRGKPTNSVDDVDDTVVKSYPLRSRTGTGRPDSRMERTADDDGVRDVSSQQSSSRQAGENSMVEMMRIFFQEREQEKLEREAYKLQKQRDRQEREQKEREKERKTERKWFDLNTMIGTMKNRLDNIDANLEARIRTVTVEYISELSTKVTERIEGILQKADACESTVGNVHKDIKVQIESCQAVTTEVSKKSAEVGAKVNKLADNVVTLQGQVNDLTQALSEINIEKRVNDAAANVRSTIGKEFVEWVETKEQCSDKSIVIRLMRTKVKLSSQEHKVKLRKLTSRQQYFNYLDESVDADEDFDLLPTHEELLTKANESEGLGREMEMSKLGLKPKAKTEEMKEEFLYQIQPIKNGGGIHVKIMLCSKKCFEKTEDKACTFDAFWDLADFNGQNAYLVGKMESTEVKRRYPEKRKHDIFNRGAALTSSFSHTGKIALVTFWSVPTTTFFMTPSAARNTSVP